jgi:predicted amidohydrolase YtcJ
MSTDHEHKKNNLRSTGCGCTPSFFVDIIENAGLELSRREFVKGATFVGAMLAAGGFETPAIAQNKIGGDDSKADIIYYGGPILTMVKDGDRVEALAVKNDKILAVGTMAELEARKGAETKLVNLYGKCLMPGFFDPHSHVVMQSVKFSTANLDPKPIGEAGSIADIQRILRDWIDKKKIKAGEWVIGWGYDDTGIEEQRHPNRNDLDAVSTDHPILLMHISSHLMTGNSKMLEEIGVTRKTKDPDGGKIQRKPGSSEPNGVLEEIAMKLVLKKLPMPTPEKAMAMLEEGISFYAKAGITTAQDCASGKGTLKLLEAMEQKGKLPIDIIAWPLYKGMDDAVLEAVAADRGTSRRFRRGGLKMTVDGSIQGYTAFLSKPYYVQPGGTQPTADKCITDTAEHIFVSLETQTFPSGSPAQPDEGHRGYSNMTQEEIDTWLERCDASNVQTQVHTNGDAATDMLIKAVEKVRGDKPRPDLRTTIIHAQAMRYDQLDFAAKHGLTPSFFPIHVYFWGDRHRDLFLGPERAARISPSRSALDRGIKVTLHHDAPIAGIEMLTVAWSAVNRITTSGKELGPEERITPFEALRSITADAAWQNFEEERKGTLEKGKLADMVVLSDDPLAVDPMKIKDIQVLETIKEGGTIYSAKG